MTFSGQEMMGREGRRRARVSERTHARGAVENERGRRWAIEGDRVRKGELQLNFSRF